MNQVLVVGSVNVDLTVTVAQLPGAGETVTGGTFREADGGKGANQAVAAARAGAAVTFVGAVGDDGFGARARAALVTEGVDVAGLAVVDAATGVALIVVGADGENQIAVASGANALVSAEAAAAAVSGLDAARACVVLGFETPDACAVAAGSRAAALGVPVVLNPAPARAFDPALLAAGPILTPNAGEAAALAGALRGAGASGAGASGAGAGGGAAEQRAAEAASALAARTGAAVVVTLGAAGALVLEPGGAPFLVPAPRVDAVDATGAGDAFNGTLAALLAARTPLATAVERAVAAASRSVEHVGARG